MVIGVAVGVPLGVIALAGLALFYMERRKRLNAEAQRPQPYLATDDKDRYEYAGEAGAANMRNNSAPAGTPRVEAEAGIAAAEAEATSLRWGQRAEQKYELSGVTDNGLPINRPS